MKMSEQINELAAALSAAQRAMKPAAKDRDNPFFKSQYATLASVIEAVREPFADNGLAFTQLGSIGEQGQIEVETVLMHKSGQWIAGSFTATPTKSDPQGVGSLISYLKRYALQAMAGIASADDDAEAAMGRGGAPESAPEKRSFAPPKSGWPKKGG